jgi:hypothetical protein
MTATEGACGPEYTLTGEKHSATTLASLNSGSLDYIQIRGENLVNIKSAQLVSPVYIETEVAMIAYAQSCWNWLIKLQ